MWYPVIVNQFYKSFETPALEDKSFCDRVITNLTEPVDSESVSKCEAAPEQSDFFF